LLVVIYIVFPIKHAYRFGYIVCPFIEVVANILQKPHEN
jgi:hypothetical protein